MQLTLSPRAGVRLKDVLGDCRSFGDADLRFTSCTGDSRRVREGDVFVALVGVERDGHDYVADALARGAAAIVAERYVPSSAPVFVVENTAVAYGKLCHALAGNPARHMQVVGVTGTTGKTVTTLLLAGILEAAGHRVGTMNSLGCCDSIKAIPTFSEDASPVQVAEWLARMHANGCRYALIEARSRSLARHRLAGLEFDAALVTNVGSAHLDWHGSVLGYRQAKARLLEQLKPGGFAVMNGDDSGSGHLIAQAKHPVITYAIEAPAEVTATLAERFLSEQTFLLAAGSDCAPVRTAMIGDAHIYHCLAAASAALVMGIDLPTIVRGLESVAKVPGHLERIECGQRFGAFVDRAATPHAMRSALRTLREVTRGRLICVYGPDGAADRSQRPLLGRAVEQLADYGIITSNNPGFEPPLAIAHDVIDGYRDAACAHVVPDRMAALRYAAGMMKPGDTLLVAGKGSRGVQILGDDHFYFDDREVLKSILLEKPKSNIRPQLRVVG